jgi:alpha-ribazole phosphatase
MQLYLIRHTSLALPSGICYGQSDVEVSGSFAEELTAIRSKIADISPVCSFSSPLKRCRQLAEHLELPNLKFDERLQELNFGEWEMQAWQSIPAHQIHAWSVDYVESSPPGGESFSDLYRRCSEFIADMLQQFQNQDLIAVTHSGVIRALLAFALGLPLTEMFEFTLDYGGITKLSFQRDQTSAVFINQ